MIRSDLAVAFCKAICKLKDTRGLFISVPDGASQGVNSSHPVAQLLENGQCGQYGFLVLPFHHSRFSRIGFDEKYERDYNIFNPINQYRPDNPLNPISSIDPNNTFNSINNIDPSNPADPINRVNPNTRSIPSTK